MPGVTNGPGVKGLGKWHEQDQPDFVTHYLHTLAARSMGVTALGDPISLRLVVMCHPAPGAEAFDPDPLVTNRWGVQIVAPDRPGYGASERGESPGETLDTWGDDLHEYLRWMSANVESVSLVDYSTIGMIGWGSGCLYACRFAQRHPGLVDRLALVDPPSVASATQPDELMASGPCDDVDPGLKHRWARALEQAQLQGDAGLAADRNAIDNGISMLDLRHVEAQTLLVFGDSDAERGTASWYHRQLHHSRGLRVRGGSPLIFAAWSQILQHVASKASELSIGPRARGRSTPVGLDEPR